MKYKLFSIKEKKEEDKIYSEIAKANAQEDKEAAKIIIKALEQELKDLVNARKLIKTDDDPTLGAV